MRDAAGATTRCPSRWATCSTRSRSWTRFGTDALRYYCFREVSFGQDGGVSTGGFGERYESELANELGNLASRTTSMIERYRDGAVPEVERRPALVADFEGLRGEVAELLDRAELTQALERTGSACGG